MSVHFPTNFIVSVSALAFLIPSRARGSSFAIARVKDRLFFAGGIVLSFVCACGCFATATAESEEAGRPLLRLVDFCKRKISSESSSDELSSSFFFSSTRTFFVPLLFFSSFSSPIGCFFVFGCATIPVLIGGFFEARVVINFRG